MLQNKEDRPENCRTLWEEFEDLTHFLTEAGIHCDSGYCSMGQAVKKANKALYAIRSTCQGMASELETLSALDTPATPPEDARKLVDDLREMEAGCPCDNGEFIEYTYELSSDQAIARISAYADNIRKQCAERAIEWFIGDAGEMTQDGLRAAIMRKE